MFCLEPIGASSRSVNEKLSEHISVKDFGAVGDGVADDYPAFQRAINYVANMSVGLSSGGRLHVPVGDYALSHSLVMPAGKPMELHGQGSGTKLFRLTGTGNIIECYSGSNIADLFFRGPVSASSNGILCSGANTARIENCTFQNQTTGIALTCSYAVEIISCVFEVCYTYGIVATTSAHNTMIERCNFFTCGVLNNGQAINFTVASDNLGINDNDFEYCNVNVQLNACNSVQITGNYFEYQKAACLYFLPGCTGVTIESNWIALGDVGDILQNITGGRFVHNTIYNQSIAFATSLVGFDVGLNKKTGTGTVGPAPWIDMPLVNGWTPQANYMPPSYIKDQAGYVTLRGAVLSGTIPAVVCTLPLGYRPSFIAVFGTSSSNGSCRITINPNGDIVPSVAPFNNPGFDGIRFYVGN